jgi:maltose-binding protein MalE
MLNEEGTAFTLNTPEGKEALDLMRSMVDERVVDPVLFNDTENWVGDCFFEGFCAMGLVGPWVVADNADDFPEVAAATEYVPLPAYNGSNEFIADSGWGLTVSADTPAAATAWDFVSFATLDPANAAAFNQATGTLPALKANAEEAAKAELIAQFPYFAPFFDILPNGRYVGNLPDRDLVWYDIAYPHLLAALQGTETVDDALAAMEQEANETFG